MRLWPATRPPLKYMKGLLGGNRVASCGIRGTGYVVRDEWFVVRGLSGRQKGGHDDQL